MATYSSNMQKSTGEKWPTDVNNKNIYKKSLFAVLLPMVFGMCRLVGLVVLFAKYRVNTKDNVCYDPALL